jgi:hypothetical protein
LERGKEEREIEKEDGGFVNLERKRTSLLQVEKNRAASGYAKMERKTGPREEKNLPRRWKTRKKAFGKSVPLFLFFPPHLFFLFSPGKYLSGGKIRTRDRGYEKWKLDAGKSPVDVNANG